jgi:hypothetical protein
MPRLVCIQADKPLKIKYAALFHAYDVAFPRKLRFI